MRVIIELLKFRKQIRKQGMKDGVRVFIRPDVFEELTKTEVYKHPTMGTFGPDGGHKLYGMWLHEREQEEAFEIEQ